ncbi:unnamed protein product [Victoria cruziana]
MIMGAKRAGCSQSIRIEPVIVKLLQETVAESPWIFVHGHLSDLKRSGRIPGIFCRGYHYQHPPSPIRVIPRAAVTFLLLKRWFERVGVSQRVREVLLMRASLGDPFNSIHQ